MPIPNGALQAPLLFATPVPVSSGGTGAAQIGSTAGHADVPILTNPPHSMASDAYKGLVFSLMAGGRNTEALDELNKIPPDVRQQLESDIEFVQGVASLYVAVGDTARAQAYLSRVENFYRLHRAQAPASLEMQHAWLLYNLHDGTGPLPAADQPGRAYRSDGRRARRSRQPVGQLGRSTRHGGHGSRAPWPAAWKFCRPLRRIIPAT